MADNALFTQQTGVATLPAQLRPVTPGQPGNYMPEVGKHITVDLGGEMIRCTVEEVLGPDAIAVLIGTLDPMTGKVVGVVMDKTNHGFKIGSRTGVMRSRDELGQEIWKPISLREVLEKEALDKFRADHQSPSRRTVEMPAPAIVHPDVSRETTVAPEEPRKKVLGPRRSRVSAPPAEEMPYKRVPGPRRSKIARKG